MAEYLHGRLKHLRRRLNSFVFLLFHLKIENVHQSQKMVKVVSVELWIDATQLKDALKANRHGLIGRDNGLQIPDTTFFCF